MLPSNIPTFMDALHLRSSGFRLLVDISNNNYLQLLYREFYFTKGSQDKFCLLSIQSEARNVLLAKLAEGTRDFGIARKRSCSQFYRLLR